MPDAKTYTIVIESCGLMTTADMTITTDLTLADIGVKFREPVQLLCNREIGRNAGEVRLMDDRKVVAKWAADPNGMIVAFQASSSAGDHCSTWSVK